jgi:hypothetical protein
MPRFETIVGGICAGAWIVAIALSLADGADLGRFPPPRALFTFAAIAGWLAGNVYVARLAARALPRGALVALYLGGPPGLIWLLWATIPEAVQAAAPLAPLLALAIYGVFFLVPVTLRRR